MSRVEIVCPDLGEFKDVAVIDVLAKPGDHIEVDTPLVTLESDKATMDVPSSAAGTLSEMLVSKGSRISKGTPIARVEADTQGQQTPAPGPLPTAPPPAPQTPAAARAPAQANPAQSNRGPDPAPGATPARKSEPQALEPGPPEPQAARSTQLLVLGAGPGGYTAAFRAADLGLSVTLVERSETLGGVCLNVGCIPSKALLHAAKVIEDAEAMRAHGIDFGEPKLDFDRLRSWKSGVVQRLTGGLSGLAKQRKIEVVRGIGRFLSPHVLEVRAGQGDGEALTIRFDQCIIAVGSEAARLPFLPEDARIIDSTGALELPRDPRRLLVIGGGIIGLEMACVYDALGAKVSVVELTGQLMPGCDPDLVRPLEKRIRARYAGIRLSTRVTAVEPRRQALRVSFEGPEGRSSEDYDYALVAIGRSPNGRRIDAQRAGVHVDERGFIGIDRQMRSNVPHIFAIGDVAGPPMLAHKASHEGKVAAEVAAGHKSFFDARAIPSVAYTDPEVAWTGLTETAAKAQGLAVERAAFPWAASGRSLSIGRDEGFTKLLFDPNTHRLLGGGIVGTNAGELIAEVTLAVEMAADAADVALTVHAHPTLSETVGFAAETCEGTLTDLYLPRKKA